MADDGFSVENLRVKDLPPLDPAVARPRRRSREFIQLSREQFDRLTKAKRPSAERVFLHLLFLTWRLPDKPVVLANTGLADKGIDRHAKRRALLELEALGLVRVEWRRQKSPIITVLGG
jgi:hypothetical protein